MKSTLVKTCLLLASLLLATSGCSTMKNKMAGPPIKIEPIEMGATRIRLVADTDFNEVSRYVSKTVAKETEQGQKPKTTSEEVEFAVESKIVSVDIEKERMKLSMKTTSKNGSGDLHDFAMPELGEEIIFDLDETSRVYQAGNYPAASIFFVPPLSLPDYPVRKGDTWVMDAEWINSSNKAPFHMQITSVLKEFLRCGNYRCADIEISGSAKIMGVDESKFRFGSSIRGRYIFVIETGSVLWSVVRSDQNLMTSKVHAEVKNCFFSRLESPQKMLWDGVRSTSCKADRDLPEDLAKALAL